MKVFEDYIYSDIGNRYYVELDHEGSQYFVSIWENKKRKFLIYLKDPTYEFDFSDDQNPMEVISKKIILHEKVLRDQLNLENWNKKVSLNMFPDLLEQQQEELKRFNYSKEPKIYILGERVQ